MLVASRGVAETPASRAGGGERPTVAVVLSGGAALGFAHNGVLETIEELGIPVDIVVGTSMGAIIGGFYAAGYSPADIREVSAQINWAIMFTDSIPRRFYGYRERARSERYFFAAGVDRQGIHLGGGLISGQNITALFERLSFNIPDNTDFDTLPRQFRAVAADVITGDEVIIASGSLSDAMRASMSIPGLFRPYQIDDRYLIDGGVVNNLPVDVARSLGADIVIAVEVREPLEIPVERLLRSPFAAVEQSTKFLVETNVRPQRALADLVITPDLEGYSLASFTEAVAIMNRGAEAARDAMPELQLLADRIAADRPLHRPSTSRGPYFADSATAVISRIIVEGGSESEREATRKRFEKLLGHPFDTDEFVLKVDETYASGRFDLVKTHILRDEDGTSTLLVALEPRVQSRNSIRLGMRYAGTIGSSSYSRMVLTQNFTVNDITGFESYWTTDVSFVNILAVDTAYFQPIGSHVYVQPSLGYLADSDRYTLFGSVGTMIEYREVAAGVDLGVMLSRFGELRGGYRFLLFESSTDDPDGSRHWTEISALIVSAGADTRDSRLFPSNGSAVELEYQIALPALGSSIRFQRFEIDAETHVRLRPRVSAGTLVSAGTHFDDSGNDEAALHRNTSFGLGDERVFIGYRNDSRSGRQRLAVAAELRIALNQTPGTLTAYPVVVVDGGIVETWQDYPASFSDFAWNYTSSIGLGARFTDSLAVLLRVGVVRDMVPFVALNLGAFGF